MAWGERAMAGQWMGLPVRNNVSGWIYNSSNSEELLVPLTSGFDRFLQISDAYSRLTRPGAAARTGFSSGHQRPWTPGGGCVATPKFGLGMLAGGAHMFSYIGCIYWVHALVYRRPNWHGPTSHSPHRCPILTRCRCAVWAAACDVTFPLQVVQ